MKQLLLLLCILLAIPSATYAQTALPFEETTFRARVLSVESFGERSIAETRLSVPFQKISAQIIEGSRQGETLEAENTTSVFFAPGDIFYVHRLALDDGSGLWSAGEPDRRIVLAILGVLFIGVVILTASKPGLRALLSLVVSFGLLLFVLVPLLSAGAPPALTCVAIATLMLAISMIITHGYNTLTLLALSGSIGALVVGAGVTELAVTYAKLSGFVSDETTYLHFASNGSIDLSGLLLGGILIGIVGVLNDISVSQVHTVAEIKGTDQTLSRRAVLAKAMRVGREHLGAVVNTLPLAYAGAALPLLMLFASADAPILYIINRELFSAEIIRILTGGIALALSGVFATWFAVFWLTKENVPMVQSRHTNNF